MQFGIRYLGTRRAYIKLDKTSDGNVTGVIHEYLGLDNIFSLGLAATFYISDDYVSVFGNKSSIMLGFEGIINELYETTTGKLLGYEVRETLSKIQYNTLWFNLIDIFGIDNVKKELKDPKPVGGNPNNIFINNQTSIFKTKSFGGFDPKTLSRRFDIEFRVQYVTVMEAGKQVVKKIEVPMLFIQQEKLDDLTLDIKTENNYINKFLILISTTDQTKIIEDYENLIPIFIAQKDEYTIQMILDFIK